MPKRAENAKTPSRIYEIIGAAFTLNPPAEDGKISCRVKDIVDRLGTTTEDLWAELLTLASSHAVILESTGDGDISLTFPPSAAHPAVAKTKGRAAEGPTKAARRAPKRAVAQRAKPASAKKTQAARAVATPAQNDAKVLEAIRNLGKQGNEANPLPKQRLAGIAGVPKGSIHGIVARLTKKGQITATKQADGKYNFAPASS